MAANQEPIIGTAAIYGELNPFIKVNHLIAEEYLSATFATGGSASGVSAPLVRGSGCQPLLKIARKHSRGSNLITNERINQIGIIFGTTNPGILPKGGDKANQRISKRRIVGERGSVLCHLPRIRDTFLALLSLGSEIGHTATMNPAIPRKSGFNIDDILHQRSETLAQYQASDKPAGPRAPVEGCFEDYSDPASVPHWPYLAARPESASYDAIYSASLPFYQHMIELQKTSPVVSFPFAIPNATSYFEQYGNVIEKGFSTLPTFYPHPYPAYYIPTGGSKRKGGQIRFTPQQTRSLENRFASAKYLSPEDRRHLAIQLKLSDRQVKTWFQNRRAKYRRSNNGISSSPMEESSAESSCNVPSRMSCASPSTPKSSQSSDDESCSNDHYKHPRTEKSTNGTGTS